MKLTHLFIIVLCILTGCSDKQPELSVAEPPEQIDFSCSSFYFLWGTHAEYSEHYAEALEAYEKALICDPNASYIKEKIPILMLKMGDFEAAATWLEEAIEEDPNNTTYLLFLANIFVQQEKIEEAVTLYEEILKLDPENEPVNTRLGILYSHLGDYDTAEHIFRDLLARDLDSYFTTLSLARLLNQKDEYTEATMFYEKALSLNWSKELAFEIGYLYSSHKDYEQALRLYTTITENDKFDERGLLSRIQTLLDLNRLSDAETELQHVRQFSKQPEKIDLIMSKVYLQQEKIEEAKKLLEQLNNQPEPYEARYMLALLAYRQKQYNESLHYVDQIPTSSDNFEEATYLKVKILQQQQKSDEAIVLLDRYLQDESSSSPLFYALLSSLYVNQEHKNQALTALKKGVSVFPANYQLHFEYGLLLEKNSQTQEALVEMGKVLELQPDHADALNFIGYTLADKNIRLDEALKYILHAIELKPDNGFIIDSLGWVYFRMGEFEKAVKTLEHAVSLQPNDPHIFEHLGDSYNALGDVRNAHKAYQEAYKLFETLNKKSAIKEKIDAITK